MQKRKLIEVALPLEAINRESAREKSIRHGHPSTLHLWWARRPLAAARAVLFAQLVDDPSSHPDQFPSEDDQRVERERLHRLIERLVVWENIRDEKLLAEAHAEILKSTEGNPPAILDPFAGGGTIPLEAQRLGLEAHASDLNPVAVLINKALIEIPPKFRDQPPVFPGLTDLEHRDWKAAEGLAADVRAYGQWMRDEANKRIGHLYPKAKLPDGTSATVIAWIWARTVTCPNPACGIEMPLVRSWWLGKKKGKEAYVVPLVRPDSSHPSGLRVHFTVKNRSDTLIDRQTDGTVGRNGATCLSCHGAVDLKYIRHEGQAGRLSRSLMAIVGEGLRTRVYCPPNAEHVESANVQRPESSPSAAIPPKAPSFRVQAYGMHRWSDLFTARQLTALTTFSDLVEEARVKALGDAVAAGIPHGERLEAGGKGAEAYADAVATYLGFSVSKATARNNTMCTWESGMDRLRGSFQRQAVPMTWDFAEANPLTSAGGGFLAVLESEVEVVEYLRGHSPAVVTQDDAARRGYQDVVFSTDPPYYDNIGYSDLSDFFYVWLRRSIRGVHGKLLRTLLTPKTEELVANPYRHEGKEGAKDFFEDGFRQVFARARSEASQDHPSTVWYAFKQSDTDAEGTGSTGWETLLDAMIQGGWSITSTWPSRSEMASRMIASGTNALASSIILSLRPRPDDAPTIDRRGFLNALQAELPSALKRLQEGAISPVDLPQAAIGPGMSVFSRYARVIEADGQPMTVRSALSRINEMLDQVLNEQEGDFDSTSRFAVAWYRQHGYGTGKFGDADSLARARNTSIEGLDRQGVLRSRAGTVQLIRSAEVPADYDATTDTHLSNWEALHHLIQELDQGGISEAGSLLTQALSRQDGAVDSDLVKELAHLLFRIAEGNGWTKDALSFNTLVTSWPEIVEAGRTAETRTEQQGALDFTEGDES